MKILTKLLTLTPLSLVLLAIPKPARGQIPTGAQGGADVTVGNNWTLGGEYTNIRRFIVPAGVTLTVRTYDGTANSGNLLIQADYIEIDGTISADRAGWGAAAGGGGGGGGNRAADHSTRGNSGFGATGPSVGSFGSLFGRGGDGGEGGDGGGPYNGYGGVPGFGATSVGEDNNALLDGDDGGYLGIGINGDHSSDLDESVTMGSGAGGGAGGGGGVGGLYAGVPDDDGGGGGGAGGAGGNGGGVIRLIANCSIRIGPTGSVTARGMLGGDGSPGEQGKTGSPGAGGMGGDGGSFNRGYASGMNGNGAPGGAGRNGSGRGGSGSNGGAGAGGGILLRAPILDLRGGLSNAGGRGTANGGTVKLFPGIDGLFNLNSLITGRRSGTSLSYALNTPIISPLNPAPSTNCPTSVTISDNNSCAPNVIIRYTVNGTDPTPQSPPYTGPFSVSSTSVVRARAFARGWDWTISPVAVSTIVCVTVPPLTISGYIWNDYNTNGVRDDIITGDRPNVIFVMDVSGSTANPFVGSTVGDRNGDGTNNSILDAEIAAFGLLNQVLIDRQFGEIGRVSVISFSSGATVRDMSPSSGQQLFVSPATDSDSDSIYNVDEVLRAERAGGGTNYRDALAAALGLAQSLNLSNTCSLIFLSDGVPNEGGDFTNQVSALRNRGIDLRNRGIDLRAFGVGQGASLPELQKIDPHAQVFTNAAELIGVFSGLQIGNRGAEPFFPGGVVFLDNNNNGRRDLSEPWTQSDSNGRYGFTNVLLGKVAVRQDIAPGYYETAPGAAGDHFVCPDAGHPDAILNFGNKAWNRFTPPKIQGSFMEFTFSADLGQRWIIKANSNLDNPAGWIVLTNIVGTNAWITIRDPRSSAINKRFYKAELNSN